MIDLPAAEAMYHQSCSINFRTGKDIHKRFHVNRREKFDVRPVDESKLDAFNSTLAWWENSNQECVTVSELVDQMSLYCGEPYTNRHIKAKRRNIR